MVPTKAESRHNSQCPRLYFTGVNHSSCFFAFTTNPDFGKISAGSSFIHPQLSSTISVPAMNKRVPVYVADVAVLAGANKPHRYYCSSAPVQIVKFSLDK